MPRPRALLLGIALLAGSSFGCGSKPAEVEHRRGDSPPSKAPDAAKAAPPAPEPAAIPEPAKDAPKG